MTPLLGGFPLVRPALAAAAVCALASVPATATAKTAATPSCKTIPGQTLSISGGWRVVAVTPRKGGYRSKVVACDTTRRGAALVRVLGQPDFSNEGFRVASAVGSRVILATSGGSSSGGGSTDYRLVDLAVGRSRYLGTSFWNMNPSFATVAFAMAPSGGVALASWQGVEAPGTGGPLQIADADGTRQSATLVRQLAPSIGDGTIGSGGAYYLGADGSIGRVVVPTAARLGVDHTLRLRSTRLPARAKPSNVVRTTLAANGQPGSQIELVVRRGFNADSTDSVEFAGSSDGAVALADGAGKDLKVLATGWRSVLVAARFADRPSERRIRLLVTPNYSAPTVDLPATTAAEAPGHAAVNPRDNTVYVADADQLYARAKDGPNYALPVPGIHDVSVEWTGLSGVFYTDGQGVARASGQS